MCIWGGLGDVTAPSEANMVDNSASIVLISFCGWFEGGHCRRLTPRLACTDVRGVSDGTRDNYIRTVQANISMPLYR